MHKRAFVLVFTNTTCPIVQRYLPRLKQLDAEFRDQGVQFVAVNVGPDDSVLDIATQAVVHDMPFPFVKDIDGSCVAACGVERTAAAVLDRCRLSRFAIADGSTTASVSAAPRQANRSSELRDAIQVAACGRRNRGRTETPVDGCLITKPAAAKPPANVSYAEQIAPIIERNCVALPSSRAQRRRFR